MTTASTNMHVIDCDSAPKSRDDWKIIHHEKGGQLIWNPSDVDLYVSANQKPGFTGEKFTGEKLRKELYPHLLWFIPLEMKHRLLNANVLDYLLAHPELIPQEWKKGQCIHFWGTIYQDRQGFLIVRYFRYFTDGKILHESSFPIYNTFRPDDCAAILKPKK